MIRPATVRATFAALCLLSFAAPPAGAGEAVEHSMAATFRIHAGGVSGTAFLIAVPPDEKGAKAQVVLVSAGHHFENMMGEKATLVLRAKRDDGTFKRREVTVDIRRKDEPLWTKHPDADVAAIKVDLPEWTDARPIDLGQVADEKRVADGVIAAGTEVWVPCFPAQLEGNPAGWPVLRRASVASHPLTPLKAAKTILVDYPNFGGDSGAPVVAVDGGKPVVVGIVLGMHRQTDRSSTPFEERTVHTPMALAYCAQAAFVRQTIDLLLAK